MWKNVHQVYGTGIWTHDLWNMSLLRQPLDKSSRPRLPKQDYLGATWLPLNADQGPIQKNFTDL